MTILFLTTFTILNSVLFRTIYNYVFLFNFMVFFQLALGPLIRTIGYPFVDHTILTLVVSIYVLISSIFVMLFVKLLKLNNLQSTINFDFISNKLYSRILFVYTLLVSLFLINLFGELQQFSLLELRLFYHENRSSSYLSVLFLSLGIIGPFLAFASLVRGRHVIFVIILITILLIGKKAPFFTIFVFYLFIIRPTLSMKNAIFLISGCVGLISLHQLQSTADLAALQILSGYFDYHLNLIDVLNKVYNRNCCFGIFDGGIAFSKIWYFIPRFIYEDKPEVYSHLMIHAEFYPKELATGYTRGIVANIAGAFADFGFVGLFFYGIFNALLFCVFIKFFVSENNAFLKILYMSIIFTPLAPILYLVGLLIAGAKSILVRI